MITKYKIECVKDEPKDPEMIDVRLMLLDQNDELVRGDQVNIIGISATKEEIDYAIENYYPSLTFIQSDWEDLR